MTDATENREYSVPQEGEENWHEPVNQNWQSLDRDIQRLYQRIEEIRNGDGGDETTTTATPGFGWDQTHVDTSWLSDADANGTLTVETVTTLDATGSGSLDAALNAAEDNDNTLVVFEVGGVIDYGGDTYMRSRASNVYIAGETAPAPGITVVRGGIRIYGDNTIMTHMTWLPGTEIDDPNKARSITYDEAADHVLVDHCSAGWAPDTNVNIRENHHAQAFINSINAEALNDSNHPEAPHGYALLIRAGSTGVSVLGNLISHNWKRNIKPNEDCEIVYANNYVYNWGTRVWHGSDETTECDWIGGVVEAGDDTDLDRGVFKGQPGYVHWSDNELIPESTPLNDDDIVYVDDPMHLPSGVSESDFVPSGDLEGFLAPMVGPRPADRPPWETRVIDDFTNRNGRIIDHQDDVGGYPDYSAQTRSLNPPETDTLDWLSQYTEAVEGTA